MGNGMVHGLSETINFGGRAGLGMRLVLEVIGKCMSESGRRAQRRRSPLQPARRPARCYWPYTSKSKYFFAILSYVPSARMSAIALSIFAFRSVSSLRRPIAVPLPSVFAS
jgi:hypothetical protein